MVGRREEQPSLPPPADATEALELVRSLAREVRELDEARGLKRELLSQALSAARSFGYSWVDIAKAADFVSATIARQRAKPAPSAPVNSAHPEYVGVSEASERMGVTRRTVYQWAEAGRIESIRDPSGRLRVIPEHPREKRS